MFAEGLAAFAAALCGLCVWSALGVWLSRQLGWHGPLALATAPALGCATQAALALSLSSLIGFSLWSMTLSIALLVGGAALLRPATAYEAEPRLRVPVLIFLAAALIALLPAAALLPKAAGSGIVLSAPIFDHSKVALIDQMIREGVPPANPVYGGEGGERVAYYYLWHYAAAQLGRATGVSGWEADVALTGFTAFASLCLMCGLAQHFGRSRVAPMFVLVASLAGSLRPVLALFADPPALDRVIEPASGLAGWLFQTTWSPHHVASACCVVLAALLLAWRERTAPWSTAIVLGLLLSAAFQSSLWVGGVVAALAVALILGASHFSSSASSRRPARTLAIAAGALGVATALSLPLLLDQLHAASLRGSGVPLRIAPQYVLGEALPETLRRALDVPAYWLVLWPIEFPVLAVAAVVLIVARFRNSRASTGLSAEVGALACVALASGCCGCLLFSTTGDNNDAGWRAVLPGLLVLGGAAGAAFARAITARSIGVIAAFVIAALLALPDGVQLIRGFVTGVPSPSAQRFAHAPALWAAVRERTLPNARVASDPALFADLTPWPVNIAWALLADRRSCFAGNELALAFAPLSRQRRLDIAARVDRLFAGAADSAESVRLLRELNCSTVLLTPQSGAWIRDPFADDPAFRRLDAQEDQWRLYAVEP